MRGAVLCDSCIDNITNETQGFCFSCRLPSNNGVCPACAPQLPFSHSYVVGERENELQRLLDDFKFERAYRIHHTLGVLLDETLPSLPSNTVIVPIPTIAKHIRVRGFDHADLIAGSFASRRKLRKARVLKRTTSTVQLGASAPVRQQQANAAYACTQQLDSRVTYVLVDDIATTGSTLIAAARCLKQAGATKIIVAVIARQQFKRP